MYHHDSLQALKTDVLLHAEVRLRCLAPMITWLAMTAALGKRGGITIC